MSIGRKITRKVHSLGRKTDKLAHRIGNRTHDVLSKVQGANQTLTKHGANAIHKVRKGVDLTDNILDTAVKFGAGDIPVVGGGVKLASRGVHLARKGLDKGDNALQKYKKISDKVINDGKKVASGLEKMNIRKQIEMAQNNPVESDVGFA